MADFSAFKITNVGIALEVRVQGGTPIKFTKFMLGDGTFTGNVKNLTALVNPIMEVPVSRLVSQSGDNSKVSIGFDLSSQDVTTGFYLREIGIYAEDPDGGNDILVFYGNAGNTADYIEPSTSATMTEKMIDIEMYIDSATTITAVIDSSLVYATQDDINSLQIAINDKAPNSHASSSDTYGIGTTSLFGHVKINNNLTTSSYVEGEALSAYQGYVLNNSKAPTGHASAAATYGVGSRDYYGHNKVINDLNDSSYTAGRSLSSYQGYVLNQKFSNYLPKSGGTLTGELNLSTNRIKFCNNGNIEFKEDGYGDKFRIIPNFSGADDANILNIQGTVGGAGTDPTNWKTLLQITAKSGNISTPGYISASNGFRGALTGNASSASKLLTSRKITLQGAISGTQYFDGTSNITIETVNGNLRYVTGSVSINANSQKTIELSYPSGYTKDNAILLACGVKMHNDPYNKGYNYYGLFYDSSDVLDYSFRRKVNFADSKILFTVKNPFTDQSLNIDYKIAYMKIS